MSVQIEDVVSSRVAALHSFFDNSAFVIPSYQRAYSWNKEQVRNLITDIYTGLCALGSVNNPSEEYKFFGTIITVQRTKSFDSLGIQTPSVFHEIVDGQQRITTLSIMAIQLEIAIEEQYKLVMNDDLYVPYIEELSSIVEGYCRKLQNFYSTKGANTRFKVPSIIREESDLWQEGNYKSSLSNAVLYRIYSDRKYSADLFSNDLITINSNFIQQILAKIKVNDMTVFLHENDINSTIDFELEIPKIINRLSKLELWDRKHCQFDNQVVLDYSQQNTPLLSLVRLLLIAYYLTSKCVINHIIARKQNWAFDMFVSLNTTGIPLTAIETFRANLLGHTRDLGSNFELKKEIHEQIIDLYTNREYGVQSYFDKEADVTRKMKKTNEFVTTFALAYNGFKLGYDLQRQRTWLRDSLNEHMQSVRNKSSRDRGEAVKLYMLRIKYLLKFLSMRDAVVSYGMVNEVLQASPNIDMAMLCLCFLDNVNHTIVDALLSRFYENTSVNNTRAQSDFTEIVLAVTAFFALWRSSRGTNGLPDVYRSAMLQYFSFDPKDRTFQFNAANVKQYLREKLVTHVDGKNLLDRKTWVSSAGHELRFQRMKDLSRFVIFMSLDNTTSDPDNLGLMVPASYGFAHWANLISWRNSHYATIEHIAPQNPGENSAWDSALYDDRDLFDRIGNLALLPTSINSAVGNNAWAGKWIYYSHLAEANPQKLNDLNGLAKSVGISLKPNTIKLLRNAQFSYHMDPIVSVGMDGTWDADLVERRTKRMLEIFHDRMMQWLKVEE